MNLREHLIAILQEEAIEVAHACSKALRFGLQAGYPGTDRTNEDDIARELAEMRGVVMMLRTNGVALAAATDDSIAEEKIRRIRKYLERSKAGGTLLEEEK